MFLRDIPLEDRQEATGGCENTRAFRIYTAAVKLLTDKGLIDQSVGEIAVCICANFATLPPEVETVLGLQIGGDPAIIRNDWFAYLPGGTGDDGWTLSGFGDVLGTTFCTIRDPDRAVKLCTRIYSASDANKKIRVYGWAADGSRIHTLGPDGRMADGFFVPTIYGSQAANAAAAAIVKIDHIWKDETVGFVDLLAVDPTTNEAISTLGRYRPNETTPQYTRIRVPQEEVVRVRFRRRDLSIKSDDDWINLDDPEAFLLSCKAVVKRRAGQYAEADACEYTAARLIKQAQERRQHGGISPMSVVLDAANLSAGKQGLFYRG